MTAPLTPDTIQVADCLGWLRGLPDGSVDLALTSPPYNNLRGGVMRLVEEHTTQLYDDQERVIGTVTTQIMRPSAWVWSLADRLYQRGPLWTTTVLSDGITHDQVLQRLPAMEAARAEHRSRAWNYRMHLLGEDWP